MSSDEAKKQAIVALIKGILHNGDGTSKQLAETIHSFDDLIDGSQFFYALHRATPSFFADPHEKIDSTIAANWVLRKRKMHILFADMTEFARVALSSAPDFDVNTQIDGSVLSQQGNDWKSKLLELSDFVAVMLILSGSRDVIEVLNKLSSEHQQVLSQCAKRTMGLHGFTPAKKGSQPSNAAPNKASTSGAGAAGSSASPASATVKNNDASDDIISYLRMELKDKQAQFQQLEGRCELAEKERQEWQARYNQLQEESKHSQAAAQAEKQHLQQLAKKDDTIRDLNAAVTELTTKVTFFKDKLASTEEQCEQFKKKASEAENLAKQKSQEKQDVLTQMTILQEKSEAHQRAKREMSDEIRSLKEENDKLTARLATEVAGALRGVEGSNLDDSANALNEEEFEELRQELAAAQRELALLKRSGFRSNAPATAVTHHNDGGDLGAADSTLKGGDETTANTTAAAMSEQVAALETALSLRDTRIVDLERGTGKLEQHLSRCIGELEALREENKRLSEVAVESDKRRAPLGDAEALQRDNDKLKKQLDEVLVRSREKTEATRKEQAILVSGIARVGHRNLLFQQREQLTSSSGGGMGGGVGGGAGAAGGVGGIAGFSNNLSNVWSSFIRGAPNEDVTEIPGSFLTKQRRTLERGLLDALVTAPVSSSSRR